MPFNYHLLALEHLLGTGLLAGLTLLMSIRFAEPGADRHFHATLALLALSALSVIPLFRDTPPGRLIFLPLALFVASLAAFVAFVIKATRERLRSRRNKRRNP
jgi:hypothetical protein